jgi:hypothetical protein
MSVPYRVTWVDDVFGIDPADDNVDVFVWFETGAHYSATFFTPLNIQTLLAKYAESGECAGGLYHWAANMVVVARLTKENVERVVADLLSSGEFTGAFAGPYYRDTSADHTSA